MHTVLCVKSVKLALPGGKPFVSILPHPLGYSHDMQTPLNNPNPILFPLNPHSILQQPELSDSSLVMPFLYLKILQWFPLVLRIKFHKSHRKTETLLPVQSRKNFNPENQAFRNQFKRLKARYSGMVPRSIQQNLPTKVLLPQPQTRTWIVKRLPLKTLISKYIAVVKILEPQNNCHHNSLSTSTRAKVQTLRKCKFFTICLQTDLTKSNRKIGST